MEQPERTKDEQIQRYQVDEKVGLTLEQVEERIRQGLDNGKLDVKTKSIGRILRDNLCTLFNFMNFALAFLVIVVGQYRNALFIGIILTNILIGTVQEIRAKRIVDKLSLISAPRAKVVRQGEEQEIAIEALVLDDIMVLEAGKQVCADSIVLTGECEVDESLLTGEADPVYKKAGDTLLSGSHIVAGHVKARVEHVGRENYAARITADAKKYKKPNSEIMNALNSIIKTVSVVIVPIGILLFLKQFLLLQDTVDMSIVNTVAALIGMIPEGLILLSSVVLAVGVIRLSRHKTLVQELYCIEALARVDVLCLDKTGTITQGNLQVRELIPLEEGIEAKSALSALAHTLGDNNPTFRAIAAYAGEDVGWQVGEMVPFSPVRKWSGAFFPGEGCYCMGAAGFLFPSLPQELQEKIEGYAEEGYRVLLLGHSEQGFQDKKLPPDLRPVALLLLSDVIRPEAPETLRFFREQGVDIKIISGDDPVTVSRISKRAGLLNADRYIDVSHLTDEELAQAAQDYSVFGRVSPAQKRLLVRALKGKGHTVAMTGDGVNDVLALKDADCSIAVASGSDAARNVAQLVLLDSNFASLYHVVMEGRRAINNIQRSASLFLVKTIFSFILSVLFVFIPQPYPFLPIQLTLISSFTVGIPSFFLALEPNRDRIEGDFLTNILKKAVPGALSIVFNIVVLIVAGAFLGFTDEQTSTMAVIITALTALVVLFKVCLPFNVIRGVLFGLMTACICIGVVCFKTLFYLTPVNQPMLILLLILAALILPLMRLFLLCTDWVVKFFNKMKKTV